MFSRAHHRRAHTLRFAILTALFLSSPAVVANDLPLLYDGQVLMTSARASGQPGTMVVRDRANNKLWVATNSNLREVYSVHLPRELKRLCASADYHRSAANYSAERVELQRLAALLPRNPYILYRLGIALQRLADHEGALAAHQQAVKTWGQNFESLKEIGVLHFAKKKYKAAQQAFGKALSSLRSTLRTQQAASKRKLPPKSFADSQAHIEYGYALEDKLKIVRQNLVLTYARLADEAYASKKRKTALQYLEDAMKLLPQHGGLLETYRYYAVTKPKAVGKAPTNEITIWLEAVDSYMAANDVRQALNLIRHLRTIYPDNSDLVAKVESIVLENVKSQDPATLLQHIAQAIEDHGATPKLVERAAEISNTLVDRYVTWLGRSSPDGQETKAPAAPVSERQLIALLEKVHQLVDSEDSANNLATLYYEQAKALHLAQRQERARTSIQRAVTLAPKANHIRELYSTIHVEVAKTLRDQGNLDASIESYEQALRNGRGGIALRAKIYYLKAQHFVQENLHLTRLIALGLLIVLIVFIQITSYVKRHRKNATLRRRGWSAYKRKEYAAAIEQLSAYMKEVRSSVPYQYYRALAESYQELEKYDAAVEVYRKIDYLFPKSSAYLDEAKLYIQQNKVTLLISLLKKRPNPPADAEQLIDYCFSLIEDGFAEDRLQEAIGSLYIIRGDLDRARYMFKQVIARKAAADDVIDHRFAFRKLIEIAKLQEDEDELLKVLKKYQEMNDDDPNVYLEWAHYYEKDGNDEAALSNYEKALALKYSEGVEHSARTIRQRLSHGNIDTLQEQLEKSPDNHDTQLDLARSLYQTARYVEARTHAEGLLEAGHHVTEAMRLIGLCALALKEYEAAIESLRQFQAMEPDSWNDEAKEALYGLGQAYIHTKEYELGIETFQKLADIDRNFRDCAELAVISITQCPYCHRDVLNNESRCPFCESQIRKIEKQPEEIMLGAEQFGMKHEEVDIDTAQSVDRDLGNDSKENAQADDDGNDSTEDVQANNDDNDSKEDVDTDNEDDHDEASNDEDDDDGDSKND